MMEGNKEDTDMLNCMFDDFYYNSDKQGRGELRRRSSILKQTRNLNLDICESEDTEARRKSQNAKRVSFADTFQVKEYPTGNIYDIPGRHELDAYKNPTSSQVGSCLEGEMENIGNASREPCTGIEFNISSYKETSKEVHTISQDTDVFQVRKENVGNLSREFLTAATLSFIDHEELDASRGKCAGGLALSFLEAEKENIGIISKYSAPEVSNVKASSEVMQHNTNSTEISKNFKCIQNIQNSLPSKSTFSTKSSAYDPEQFFNKTTTLDDMDITCLPSPKAESYPNETNNKTRLTISDMAMTCVAGNDFLDESLQSDVFLQNSTITSDDEGKNHPLVLGKLNMVAPAYKKKLDLSCIKPALSFENIKSLSSTKSGNGTSLPDFLANTDSTFHDKVSEKHSKDISEVREENFKLPNMINRIQTNSSEISTNEHTGVDVRGIGSHAPQKEKIEFDENSHYSQDSAHGVKFMKLFLEKDNSQDRVQVSSSVKSHFPTTSTNFLEDKENIGYSRKRRSTETSSELRDVLNNKGTRQQLMEEKTSQFNSENDTKTNRNALNHATPHSESIVFKGANEPLFTHSTNVFSVGIMNAICKSESSRKGSVNLENSFNYLSEDLKFKNRENEHPLFDQKSPREGLKARHCESEGMELTSIAGSANFHFIEGDDSFEEKQQKESGKSLNMDHSFVLTSTGRTCHYTSDKMELTCTDKSGVKLNEMSNNSSLNNVAAMLELSNHKFDRDIQPKNNRMHHTTSVENENRALNSRHNESKKENQLKKYFDLPVNSSMNNYQSGKNEVMNQTLVSQEMQLTCTFKTSVASPFLHLKGAYPPQPSCSTDFKTVPFDSDDDSKVKKDPLNFGKPFLFNEIDKSFLVEQKYVFQSNTMDITCNTETSFENSFNFANSTNCNRTEEGKFGDASAEFLLHNKPNFMENYKTHHFDSEGMELTCVASNDELDSVNDESFEVNMQKESAEDLNFKHNLQLLDSSKTRNFTSDKMELTCAVKSCAELKKSLNDESDLNIHCKSLSTGITSESGRHYDDMSSQINQPNVLHSLDVEKENMVLNSIGREKEYRNCHSVETFPGLGDDSNLSLSQSADNKCVDQTFNSHEMELTLMADKSHKLQLSPFFHLSSHSSIAEEKCAFNFQNRDDAFHKKFQISQPNLYSLCKKIEESNPQENIPCDSPDNKMLQTKQPSIETDSVASEDNGNVWDIALSNFDSKDAKLKMPLALKNLSQTPGAVYTLRKKRKQITENFLKECILSPEVKYILRKSEKFNLKRPYTEMKAHSPVSYGSKKSSSFHSFGMEGSFTAESKENVLPPTVQPFHLSLKSVNENSGMTSIASSTPSTSALMKGNIISESNENSQLLTVQSFNSSLKTINKNSGMTSVTSLTPGPTSAFTSFVRPEVNSSHQNNKVALLEEKSAQHLSQIEYKQKSKNISVNENDSLQLLSNSILDAADSLASKTMSELFPAKILGEKSLLKNESGFVQSSTQDSHLPSKTSDLNMDLKEKKMYMKNPHGILPLSINQNEIKLKNPILGCKPETLNLEMRCNDQNAIKNQDIPKDFTGAETDLKCDEAKNTLISEERDLKNLSHNSNAHENQRFMDLNISERPVLESTKSTNLPEVKNLYLQKTNNPVALEKTIIRDKISDLSCNMSKCGVADLQDTSCAFVSEVVANENEVSGQSKNQLHNRTSEKAEILIHSENNASKADISKLSDSKPIASIHHLQQVSAVIDPEKPIIQTEALMQLKKFSEVLNSDIHKANDSIDQDENSNLSVVNIPLSNKSVNLLKQSNNLVEREISYSIPNETFNLEKTSLKTVTSKNVGNSSGMKILNYCEKSSSDKAVLKTDSSKWSEVTNVQNISKSCENDHKVKSDAHELNTSSNKIPNQSNNFSINPRNFTVSLNGNSPCKTNSDPKFSHNEMEINNAIWRTSNINESVKDATIQANEKESLEGIDDMSTSDCCSSGSDQLQDLDSLRNKYEEASKGTHWKLKSLNKEEAVFKLEWGVWLYRCVIVIHVSNTNLGESSITLTPCFEDPDDEYETLGYKFFLFLAKDEISFSAFTDDIIEKLAEYSNIAERVETFMRDIMHVSLDQIYTLSDDMDPLELCVEVLNDKHMSQLLLMFHVNLRTYPSERIIPEVKHMRFNDITKEVEEAITNIEPGENYLWNMVKLASKL